VAADEWPSAALTAFTLTPDEINMEAKAWRRSW
jgi:hypothetical protein